MRYVILGAGKVGVQVAQFLSEENHTVTIMDKDRKRILKIQNRLDCKTFIDDGQKQQVLIDAKVEEADFFIAATNSDEINLICCSLIRDIAPKVKCVARIRSDQYLEYLPSLQSSFNVHQVVQPEREIATTIVRSIEYGRGISDAFSFIDFNHILIRSYKVHGDSQLIGTSLKDLGKTFQLPKEVSDNLLLVMIIRDEKSFLPSGEDTIEEGDDLYFIGSLNNLDILFEKLGTHSKDAKSIRKIMIIGGGVITKQILDIYYSKTRSFTRLIGKSRIPKRNIVVVENDEAICEELSEAFPDITVLNADVTEDQMLEDLEISSADLVIAATGSQELNIVVAAHSHNLGVSQTIAVVNSHAYSKIAQELGIGISFSIREAVTNSMVQYLRGTDSVLNIGDGELSVFVHKVHTKSYAYKKKIKDLKLPKNSLIVCINRKDSSFIARGSISILDQDQLLIMSTQESFVKIKKLFLD